jgi:hypothetical protein
MCDIAAQVRITLSRAMRPPPIIAFDVHQVIVRAQAVLANQDRCKEFAESFMQYSDLWTLNMNATLEAWLTNHSTTNEGAQTFLD